MLASNAGNRLLALIILAIFFLMIYAKMQNKSFQEVFKDIKGIFGGEDD